MNLFSKEAFCLSLVIRLERLLGIDIRYAIRSGLWLNMNSAVTIIGSFLVSIAFANLLPKEVFGTYQYLLSILSLLTAFTLTGMNSSITRAVAQGNDSALRASVRPQIIWNTFSACVALAISVYYLLQGDIRLGVGTLCIAVALPLITTFNSYGAFLIGKKAFRTHFFYTTAANLAYYAIIIVALVFVPDVLPLILVNVTLTTLAPIILYLLTLRRYSLKKPAADPDTLSYGKHLSLMNFIGTVSYQIDNFLVFHFLGPVQLATYSMATLIPGRLGGIFKNITNAMLPRFAEQSMTRIRAGIVRKSFFFLALVLGTIGFYWLLAPTFFRLVYPQYFDSVPYTQLFALTLLVTVGNFIGTALLAHKKIKGLYIINTASPVANIVFQLIGIVMGGLWGLIIGRVASGILFVALTLPTVYFSSREPNK